MEALQQDGDDVLIHIKAVPGSSRDVIRGLLGDRLKVAVSAPPEGGKANAAIIRLLRDTLGVHERDIELHAGSTSVRKSIRVRRAQLADVASALGV
jgi:uncharacterized protein (TIGR00251 family)